MGTRVQKAGFSFFVFMQTSSSLKPIDIKIATVVAVNVAVHTVDIKVLNQAMQEMTGGAPDFFDGELAILDVGTLDSDNTQVDWAALISLFKQYRLNPVAVRNAPAALQADILAHGLSLDEAPAPHHSVQEVKAPEPVAQPSPPAGQTGTFATMIIDAPVRAGQRVYARGADLIITAAVNNGAEVIADGSIHVYAPLRGRALAGASGHTEARIFSMSMEPELVSIAGVYRTFENGFPGELAGKVAQVRLDGDRIDVLGVNPHEAQSVEKRK